MLLFLAAYSGSSFRCLRLSSAVRRRVGNSPTLQLERDHSQQDEASSKDFLVRLLVPGNESSKTADIMYGVIKLSEAVSMAENMKLDLIVLNEKLNPPLYKIADEAKLAFDKEKRLKEAAKKTAKVDLKEVKLSFQISDHDMDVRMKIAQRFLGQGDRVYYFAFNLLLRIILNFI